MDNAYIVSGSFFGDEGKGSVVDYLSCLKNIKENVRYNGGSQASHTVVVDGVKHKFISEFCVFYFVLVPF